MGVLSVYHIFIYYYRVMYVHTENITRMYTVMRWFDINYVDINCSNSVVTFSGVFFLNFVLNTEDQTLLCYNMYIEEKINVKLGWITLRFVKLVNYMQFRRCDYAVNYTHVNWKVLRVNARCIYICTHRLY